MTQTRKEHCGALVGWSTNAIGNRMTLRLQSVTKPPPHHSADVHSQYLVLDKNQAVQLGNYLLEMADTSAPPRGARGLFARLFG